MYYGNQDAGLERRKRTHRDAPSPQEAGVAKPRRGVLSIARGANHAFRVIPSGCTQPPGAPGELPSERKLRRSDLFAEHNRRSRSACTGRVERVTP